jgi:hypothetical protein
MWPEANVGVVTGPTSGVWMLGPDGGEGLADLRALEAEHGPLPPTLRSRSGSGGEHLIFRWPADGLKIPNARNHRRLKIDVRGCGDGPGYFVAPPSRNANGEYRWANSLPPAEAPPWLLGWVRGVTPKVPPPKPRPGAAERAVAYLAKCPPAVSGQGGHGQTFAAARALVWGFELSEDVALDLLKTHYNPRCAPLWSEKELRHKVADAAAKDFGKPRGYLLDADGRANDVGRAGGTAAPGPGWGPPAPLPTMPPVPPFPLCPFPAKVADYWSAVAESLAVPVDYVAVPGLALLGAAVGRSRAAEVKPGYSESPLFWVVVIAPPGGTKSPSLTLARAPLAKAEAECLDRHRGEMTAFEAEAERHNARMKEWRAGGCEGEQPEKPRRPTLRQATLDDATTEAVGKVLAENPRGVIVVKDELSGFVRSMDQYKGGRGADRQFWLSAWAGAPAKVNRAKDHSTGPLVIPHPFAAVAGMMCPDSLAELRGEDRHGDAAADGFLDRFLLSFPDPLPAAPEAWRTIPDDVAKGYGDVFLDLLGMDMVPVSDAPGAPTRYRPYFVAFSRDARGEWEVFTTHMADRMNALDPYDPYRGVLSKLRGYGVRFAALLWSVRRACGRLQPDAPIDADVMAGAAELVDYFERHAARALGRGWADRPSRVAHRLLRWLARHPDRKGFNRTDAFIVLKDRRDVKTSEALAPAFRLLVDHGYLRPLDRPENARPGPVPETYTVNPSWDRSTPG